jgi:hypothetical protein
MERTSDEVPFLVAQTGPLNGQRWALSKSILLGRDPDCDVIISDRQVSRHHARLSFNSDKATLEDLGSKNGTHYNGEPLTGAVQLQDGDVIQIALAQRFIFLSSDSTIPLENLPAGALGLQPHGIQPNSLAGGTGRLRLEKRSRRVWIMIAGGDGTSEEREILPPLSVSQFRLLEILFDNPGKVVSRPDLVLAVWGEGQAFEISEQALDALVRRLRDRISLVDSQHEYIVTVRGHGLRLENPPA